MQKAYVLLLCLSICFGETIMHQFHMEDDFRSSVQETTGEKIKKENEFEFEKWNFTKIKNTRDSSRLERLSFSSLFNYISDDELFTEEPYEPVKSKEGVYLWRLSHLRRDLAQSFSVANKVLTVKIVLDQSNTRCMSLLGLSFDENKASLNSMLFLISTNTNNNETFSTVSVHHSKYLEISDNVKALKVDATKPIEYILILKPDYSFSVSINSKTAYEDSLVNYIDYSALPTEKKSFRDNMRLVNFFELRKGLPFLSEFYEKQTNIKAFRILNFHFSDKCSSILRHLTISSNHAWQGISGEFVRAKALGSSENENQKLMKNKSIESNLSDSSKHPESNLYQPVHFVVKFGDNELNRLLPITYSLNKNGLKLLVSMAWQSASAKDEVYGFHDFMTTTNNSIKVWSPFISRQTNVFEGSLSSFKSHNRTLALTFTLRFQNETQNDFVCVQLDYTPLTSLKTVEDLDNNMDQGDQDYLDRGTNSEFMFCVGSTTFPRLSIIMYDKAQQEKFHYDSNIYVFDRRLMKGFRNANGHNNHEIDIDLRAKSAFDGMVFNDKPKTYKLIIKSDKSYTVSIDDKILYNHTLDSFVCKQTNLKIKDKINQLIKAYDKLTDENTLYFPQINKIRLFYYVGSASGMEFYNLSLSAIDSSGTVSSESVSTTIAAAAIQTTSPQFREDLYDQSMLNQVKDLIRRGKFKADDPLNNLNDEQLINLIKQSKHRESFERFLKKHAGFNEHLLLTNLTFNLSIFS